MRIFLIGYMGSGKSSFGKKLAKKLNLRFFDLDKRIEEKAGKRIPDIFAEYGETHFRELEKDELEAVVTQNGFVLATGGGTPCFYDNLELMNHHGLTIYLRMDASMLAQRLFHSKTKRPLVAGMNKQELNGFVKWQLFERELYYLEAHHSVNIAKSKMEDVVKFCHG